MKSKLGLCIFLILLLTLVADSTAFGLRRRVAQQQSHRSTSRHARIRRTLWNPMFRPSRDSLLLQNAEINRMELPRIQDDEELEQLKASGDLVEIVPSEYLRIDPRLDPNRRYCRPWTLEFLNDLSRDFYRQFNAQIQVNSAVRTVKVQQKLRRHNRNAAPAEGEIASSHLAGITVDIQRRGLSKEQIEWVQQYMRSLREQGLIEPEEERRQWVFHVMVSGRYSDWRDTQIVVARQAEEKQTREVTAEEPPVVSYGSGPGSSY